MGSKTTDKLSRAAHAAPPHNAHEATTLLAADHAHVKSMFEQYEALGERAHVSKKRLAMQICQALRTHATAEEELFYPAVREAAKDYEDLVDEAQVEHATVKNLIGQLEAMDAGEDLFDAKVKVLSELVEHHVEEEENEIFPKARKSGMDLLALGEAIEARKAELDASDLH